MTTTYDETAPKRPTNLRVNRDLLRQARAAGINLSATLEEALAERLHRRQRDEWLAPLRAHFDDDSHVLTLRRDGAMVAQGDLETKAGRAAIERYFADRHVGQIKGPPKVLVSPGHSFSDVPRKVVSFINLASLRAIEDMVQAPVHPLRFRANLYVEGWPAWHEAGLLDQTIAIGSARAKVVKRITRCAAVNVDPETGARDLSVPNTLMQRFGNNECGIYAEIISDGGAAVGDTIAAEPH